MPKRHRQCDTKSTQLERSHRKPIWVWIGLVSILLIGLALRLRYLTQECPWYDELITIRHLDAPTLHDFLAQVRELNEPVPPLYFIIEYFWAHVFGPSTLGLRILSLGIGLATIVALFDLTAVLFGSMAGLLAAFCLAVNYQHSYYSQEIRMYVLVGLLAVLSMRTYISVLDRGGKAAQYVNALLNLLLVWTHPMSILLPFVQGMHLLFLRRRQWRGQVPWYCLHLLVAVSIVAWSSTRSQSRLAEQLEWIGVASIWLQREWSLEQLYMGIMNADRMRLESAVLLLLGAAALFALRTVRHPFSLQYSARDSREIGTFLLAWLFVPAAILFLTSLFLTPCFVERYLLHICFPAYIILAALVTFLKTSTAKAIGAGAILVFMASGVLFLPNGPSRLPIAEIAAQIRPSATPGDTVLLMNPVARFTYETQYYLKRADLTLESIESSAELRFAIRKCMKAKKNLWVIAVHSPEIQGIVKETGVRFTSRSWPGRHPAEFIHILAPT